MDAHTVLSRSEDATFEVVADEAVLIHLDTGTYYSLNDIGTEFWEMLDGEQSIREHAAVTADKYDVDVNRVIDDFIDLAEEMNDAGLVIIHSK